MEDKEKELAELLEKEKEGLTEGDVTEELDEDGNPIPPKKEGDDEGTPEEKEKKRQTREQNAKFAELRRQKAELEKKNKELEAEAQKASFNAKKEGISKETLASIGLDSVETESDLILAKAYDKAIADGSEEPLKDALKVQREHNRKEAETARAKIEQEDAVRQKIVEDQAAFKKKFGKETSEIYGKDEQFMKLFGDLLQPGNFTALYTRYKEVYPDDEEEDEEAKAKGKIPTPSNKTVKKTKKELHELEGEAFLEEWDKQFNN